MIPGHRNFPDRKLQDGTDWDQKMSLPIKSFGQLHSFLYWSFWQVNPLGWWGWYGWRLWQNKKPLGWSKSLGKKMFINRKLFNGRPLATVAVFLVFVSAGLLTYVVYFLFILLWQSLAVVSREVALCWLFHVGFRTLSNRIKVFMWWLSRKNVRLCECIQYTKSAKKGE